MKRIEIIKEANIGSSIELSNVELTVIKTKWNKITEQLSNEKRLSSDLVEDITHFSGLIEKLCGDVLSLEETAHELFSSEPISEDEMRDIIEASTSSYHHDDDEVRDFERMERKEKFDGTI